MPDRECLLEYGEVKDMFLTAAAGRNPLPEQPYMATLLATWPHKHPEGRSNWHGATVGEMAEWLRHGYHVGELLADLGHAPTRKRRRLRFDEEGELQVDLALSGFDYPFLTWEQRERKPGLAVVVEIGFLGNAAAQAIADYGRFVARTIATLETAGYDLDAQVTSRAAGCLHVPDGLRVNIHLKRENEASDFAAWSAMFTPGTHRMLVFGARALAAERLGLKLKGAGGSTMSGWGIRWDADTRTLTFTCDSRGHEFPEQDIAARLAELHL